MNLKRNLVESNSYKREGRSADDTGDNLGDEERDIFTSLETNEEIDNLEE